MKKIAVYCGASVGTKPIYQERTKELGEWMGTHKYDLVYGGGNVGLMGVLADTVLATGGKAIGVMPTFLLERELAHQEITEMHIVNDMHERKRKMIDLADCYIALPGGPGTLEEISEVVSWGRVGEHQNPCIFFNVDGYYDLLADFFDKMVLDGFLTKKDRENIFFSKSLDDIQMVIDTFTPSEIRQYK